MSASRYTYIRVWSCARAVDKYSLFLYVLMYFVSFNICRCGPGSRVQDRAAEWRNEREPFFLSLSSSLSTFSSLDFGQLEGMKGKRKRERETERGKALTIRIKIPKSSPCLFFMSVSHLPVIHNFVLSSSALILTMLSPHSRVQGRTLFA